MMTINLDWKGPVTYSNFNNIDTIYPDINESGIYLWGIENNSKVFINYVGQATNIKGRLFEEFINIQRKKSSLIDVEKFLKTGFMDIVYIPEYQYEPNSLLVKDNLDKHIIYYAVMKTILKDSQLKGSLLKVEGAIQARLFLNGETRGYLMTKVSTWTLRDIRIINNIPTGINLFGIEPEIISQNNDFKN